MTAKSLTVRLPADLRENLDRKTGEEGRTLNDVVVEFLYFALRCPWKGFKRPADRIHALEKELAEIEADARAWAVAYDKLKAAKAQKPVPHIIVKKVHVRSPVALDLLRAWLEETEEHIKCPECEADLKLTWKTTKATEQYLGKARRLEGSANPR